MGTSESARANHQTSEPPLFPRDIWLALRLYRASHARLVMKGLWYESRRRWEANGRPTIDFDFSRVQREALSKTKLARFVTDTCDEGESDEDGSDEESTDSTVTNVEEVGDGEDVEMAED